MTYLVYLMTPQFKYLYLHILTIHNPLSFRVLKKYDNSLIIIKVSHIRFSAENNNYPT